MENLRIGGIIAEKGQAKRLSIMSHAVPCAGEAPERKPVFSAAANSRCWPLAGP